MFSRGESGVSSGETLSGESSGSASTCSAGMGEKSRSVLGVSLMEEMSGSVAESECTESTADNCLEWIPAVNEAFEGVGENAEISSESQSLIDRVDASATPPSEETSIPQSWKPEKLSVTRGEVNRVAKAVKRGSVEVERREAVEERAVERSLEMCDSICSTDCLVWEKARAELQVRDHHDQDERPEVRDCLDFSRRSDLRLSKSSEASR